MHRTGGQPGAYYSQIRNSGTHPVNLRSTQMDGNYQTQEFKEEQYLKDKGMPFQVNILQKVRIGMNSTTLVGNPNKWLKAIIFELQRLQFLNTSKNLNFKSI